MTRNIIKTLLFTATLFFVVTTGSLAQTSIAPANAPANAATDNHSSPKDAATDTKKRSLFAGRNAPAPQSAFTSGPFGRFYAWLMTAQQQLHRALAAAVKDLKSGSPLWAALVLGAISFAYGVLHAAGPGHGKAVISSYVLANERTVKRGIALSFLAAAIQGLSALVIVAILVLVLNATSIDIKATEGWIETLSWGLVTLIGIWLLYGQTKLLVSGWQRHEPSDTGTTNKTATNKTVTNQTAAVQAQSQAPHGSEHKTGDELFMRRAYPKPHPHQQAAAEHNHHGENCGCGHSHMPTPEQLSGAWSWPKALAVAFSVGIRPCTGAIIVLVFAISQGLMWAGVFATFAMALGTAITVSALAALAVGGRELAMRLAGEESRWGWRIERTAGLGGAVLVTLLGAMLFMGSFQPAAPF